MNRRDLLLGAGAMALAACSKQAEGIEEIHYGRDVRAVRISGGHR